MFSLAFANCTIFSHTMQALSMTAKCSPVTAKVTLAGSGGGTNATHGTAHVACGGGERWSAWRR